MLETHDDLVLQRLLGLERALVDHAGDLALYLVFDRPERANERPGLASLRSGVSPTPNSLR
jgi:hypothetical protein